MMVIDIHERDVFSLAIDEIRRGAIAVQLPTGFVLLAAPTEAGAMQLDAAKTRLAGKNYGTAIGSLNLFLGQAMASSLPEEFNRAEHFERMTGSFIRLQFRAADFQSSTIRSGTHQGVLLDGVHRELFRQIEASFLWAPPETMWGNAGDADNYCAPLCTCCNISGDPGGSIVRLDKALQFAEMRGVRLVLSCRETASELAPTRSSATNANRSASTAKARTWNSSRRGFRSGCAPGSAARLPHGAAGFTWRVPSCRLRSFRGLPSLPSCKSVPRRPSWLRRPSWRT